VRALTLLLALALAGCASAPVADTPAWAAPQIRCADQCRTTCDTRLPAWLPPDARSPLAWDYIKPQVVVPLKAELDRCEARRASCVACIDAAIEAGAVRP
jgi:hypothetical protein